MIEGIIGLLIGLVLVYACKKVKEVFIDAKEVKQIKTKIEEVAKDIDLRL